VSLSRVEIAALCSLRAKPTGHTLFPTGRWFCGGTMSAATFRRLAGNGFVDVKATKILITQAGLDFIHGVP
jgi:hypothetical protein